MTIMSAADSLSAEDRSDIEDAALLAFELLNELGFTTGDLIPADFRLPVRPLLTGLNLRVATPERLAREQDGIVQLDYIEAMHVSRVRRRLRELNAAGAWDGLPW